MSDDFPMGDRAIFALTLLLRNRAIAICIRSLIRDKNPSCPCDHGPLTVAARRVSFMVHRAGIRGKEYSLSTSYPAPKATTGHHTSPLSSSLD